MFLFSFCVIIYETEFPFLPVLVATKITSFKYLFIFGFSYIWFLIWGERREGLLWGFCFTFVLFHLFIVLFIFRYLLECFVFHSVSILSYELRTRGWRDSSLRKLLPHKCQSWVLSLGHMYKVMSCANACNPSARDRQRRVLGITDSQSCQMGEPKFSERVCHIK